MSKPLRILMLSHCPGEPSFGVALAQLRLGKEMERAGHSVDHMFLEDFPLAHRWPRLMYFFLPFEALFKVLMRCLRRGPYDVVDVTSGEGCLLFPALALFYPATRRFYRTAGQEHTKAEELVQRRRLRQNTGSLLHRIYFRGFRFLCVEASMKLAHGCLFNSEHDMEWTVRKGWCPRQRCDRTPLGVREDLVLAAPPAKDPRQFLFLGQWMEQKGIQVLAPLFARLQARDARCRLTVGGISPSYAAVDVYGDFPEAVRGALTVVPHYTLQELKVLADDKTFFLFPSLYEGFGLVVLEAMARGAIPVMWRRYGVSTLLQDGVDSLLVAEPDVPTMLARITAVWDDSATLRRMSEGALATARRLSWKSAAAGVLDFYRNCP